jgi:hypothetical protein
METQSRRKRVIHRSKVQFICPYYFQLHSVSQLFRGLELKIFVRWNKQLSCTMHRTRVNSELHQCDSRHVGLMLLLLMHINYINSFYTIADRPHLSG